MARFDRKRGAYRNQDNAHERLTSSAWANGNDRMGRMIDALTSTDKRRGLMGAPPAPKVTLRRFSWQEPK